MATSRSLSRPHRSVYSIRYHCRYRSTTAQSDIDKDGHPEALEGLWCVIPTGPRDKGKKDSENPVPHLEKIASQQAHKITGYTRTESDDTDKKNNKARIKNNSE